MAEVKTYTLEEVKKHNTADDLWVIVHGKVYDLSQFKDHPGGTDILEEYAGMEASEDFEDAVHSDKAIAQMKDFYVGDFKK
eukprot:CAMPEP_0114997632 /NCGR_PEP_ID=MMETSP0216-20121206/15012_1 /TAXON_ID=223996 /ORGANISM="Protocruzia adherens, Strain Boccale" /LENGTH=80 /DNA_ID=CAMNT_0002362045 /DNA_START=45 /DNA_END=287 /DNA_ORIENTATION=+